MGFGHKTLSSYNEFLRIQPVIILGVFVLFVFLNNRRKVQGQMLKKPVEKLVYNLNWRFLFFVAKIGI